MSTECSVHSTQGDNVLINTFSGLLKISDFGTSKRLAGITPCTETFTGNRYGVVSGDADLGQNSWGLPGNDVSPGHGVRVLMEDKTQGRPRLVWLSG